VFRKVCTDTLMCMAPNPRRVEMSLETVDIALFALRLICDVV